MYKQHPEVGQSGMPKRVCVCEGVVCELVHSLDSLFMQETFHLLELIIHKAINGISKKWEILKRKSALKRKIPLKIL